MTSATSVQNGSSARGARRRPPAPRPTPPERRRGRAIAAARRSATRSAAVALALCMVWSVVMDERVSAACWREPVIGVVVDPFRPPPCPWCAGNRGLEYRTAPGGRVRSVAAGTVAFSGAVAGTRYVVVTLASGWKVTYGRPRRGRGGRRHRRPGVLLRAPGRRELRRSGPTPRSPGWPAAPDPARRRPASSGAPADAAVPGVTAPTRR